MGCNLAYVSQLGQMWTSNKKKPLLTTYQIRDHPIWKVTSAKYLGITITQNLSWSKHIDTITSKVNSVRAFLQRNLSQCPPRVKSIAYFTYVRPIFEYASVVWSPFTKTSIDKVECTLSLLPTYSYVLDYGTHYQRKQFNLLI